MDKIIITIESDDEGESTKFNDESSQHNEMICTLGNLGEEYSQIEPTQPYANLDVENIPNDNDIDLFKNFVITCNKHASSTLPDFLGEQQNTEIDFNEVSDHNSNESMYNYI